MITDKPKDENSRCRDKFRFPISDCVNMKSIEGDMSMTNEYYSCKVCGNRDNLDYDEMR